MARLTYNSIELPSFAKTGKIRTPLLPPISLTTATVPGRAGSYYFGQSLGDRVIEVGLVIVGDSRADLPAKKRALADWLFYDEPKPLILPDEPDKYYLAIVSGDTDLDELLNTGRGTITFVCNDPFAYGTTTQTANFAGNVFFLPLNADSNGDGLADGMTGVYKDASITGAFSVENGAQKIHCTSSTGSTVLFANAYKSVSVTGGKKYKMSALIKTANLSANASIRFVAGYRNSGGQTTNIVMNPAINTNLADFTLYSWESTAPADAVQADFKVELRLDNAASPGNIGTVWFKDFNVDDTTNASPGASSQSVTVTNNGGLEAYPQLHFEFNGSTTEFGIFSGEDFIYFGQPTSVDSQTETTKRTKILDDDCSSVASYTAGVSVDGGTITGSLTSDGVKIKASDYGSGSTWHGPAGVRDLGQQIQDFSVQVECGFKAGYPYQVGRLEIYLLDINNTVVGKLAIRDSTGKLDNPYMEARAGNSSTGRVFVNYTGPVGNWKQFNGPIRLTRIGNRWEFSASRRDENGRLYNTFTHSFIDKDNQYNQKLAKIQIHFGQYGTNPTISTNYIEQIQVWNEKTLLSTEVPYIFESGDSLDIDCATGTITKTSNGNQEPFYYQMDPASTFIRILKGTNQINVYPNNIIAPNSYVTFRERWL